MYALVNTMAQVQGDSIGTVLSCHRTIAAARVADGRVQRMTRKANGYTSYLPTRIVRLLRRPEGRHVGNLDWEAI
jgi:hypothetical protein